VQSPHFSCSFGRALQVLPFQDPEMRVPLPNVLVVHAPPFLHTAHFRIRFFKSMMRNLNHAKKPCLWLWLFVPFFCSCLPSIFNPLSYSNRRLLPCDSLEMLATFRLFPCFMICSDSFLFFCPRLFGGTGLSGPYTPQLVSGICC